MITIWQNSEARLMETAQTLKSTTEQYYVIFFNLNRLQEHYRSEFQLRIAANVISDIFKEFEGFIFNCENADMVVVYHGDDKTLVDKAIFQLRYLFVDDPIANHEDGSENEAFSKVFDLEFQWRDFYDLCANKMGIATKNEIVTTEKKEPPKTRPLTPETLSYVQEELGSLDIGLAFRNQPVCAVKKSKSPITILYSELYTNISHLKKLLPRPVELLSDRWLFKYLTLTLDQHVLQYLGQRSKLYLKKPISININVDTILSAEFMDFHEKISGSEHASMILEINVADVYTDMRAFLTAKDLAQELGYKVCLDGLTNMSFAQIDRKKLGFDLAKLMWNADMESALDSKLGEQLQYAIDQCGANRMILCRCDDKDAIEYGHALGISLFQGRYTDSLVNPDATIVN